MHTLQLPICMFIHNNPIIIVYTNPQITTKKFSAFANHNSIASYMIPGQAAKDVIDIWVKNESMHNTLWRLYYTHYVDFTDNLLQHGPC